MSKGTVVEFDLNKHTTLGVIDGHKVKAKGGLRYEIKTSDGKLHAGVAPRDIHFSAPGAKNNLDEMLQAAKRSLCGQHGDEYGEFCLV